GGGGGAQARRPPRLGEYVQLPGAGLLQEARLPGVRQVEGLSRGSLVPLAAEGSVMSSNIKPKTPAKEAPTEPFKRAVTGCLRAIARHPELEVSFAAERPGMVGGKARLPEPPRKLTRADAAIVRGHADSIALRMACHDAAVHRRLVPGGQQARAVFEAVEQARLEAGRR